MARKDKRKLTDQQRKFADLYLKDPELNASAAYREAYPKCSVKAAESGSSRLLRNEKVAAYIQKRMDARAKKAEVDQDYVITALKELVEMCMGRAPMPKSLVVDEKAVEYEIKEVVPAGATKALELLGKNLKMFTEKVEHGASDELKALLGLLGDLKPTTGPPGERSGG
jgi:phage terminase small subunit